MKKNSSKTPGGKKQIIRRYKVRANHRGESNFDYIVEGLSDEDKFPDIPKKYKHIHFENCFIEKPIILHDNVKSISFYESYVKFSKFPEKLNELVYRSCDSVDFPRNFKNLDNFYAITAFRCDEELFSVGSLPETTRYVCSYSLEYEKDLKKLPRDLKRIYLKFYVDEKNPSVKKYHESYRKKEFE